MPEIISDVNLQMVIRVFVAAVLGVLVGLEREYVGKAAGMRTYGIVSMGAALFTVISLFGAETLAVPSQNAESFRYNYDPTRIVSQIVVGIGFIGAGLIIFRGFRVEGLTTAAGLWTSAAIGTAVGFGFYVIAIFVSALTLFIFYFLKRLEPTDRHSEHEPTL